MTDFLIVTGLSGAGKSRTVDALEDIGFYCVDNMPPKLIPKGAEICLSASDMDRVAVVTDLRSGEMFYDLFEELDRMKGMGYRVLFLDASDGELIRRYKETRRRHPLLDISHGSVSDAISNERKILQGIRDKADFIIDTTHLSANELKQRMNNLFLTNMENGMMISVLSFGFKHGLPADADLVFDVRCLPNPFYVDSLKRKTGLDEAVKAYVMDSEESQAFLAKIKDLTAFAVPLYEKEGKSQLMIAIGCTGGHHRSVTFAEYLYRFFQEMGRNVRVTHRDIGK